MASLVIGLIPAWKTRCLTVLGGISNSVAISRMVQPFASIFYSKPVSGFLGGRPLPGTLRMASRADGGYTGEWVIGLILATMSRCLTVVSFMPNFSAISATVKPSIHNISEKLTEKLNIFKKYDKAVSFAAILSGLP
jgi:hypothetical protein